MKGIIGLFMAYMFKNRPLYIHYGITHRCNLRCRMCKIYNDTDESEELSLREIEKIFIILKKLGSLYVSIGGGEPFLRKDLIPVVTFLRQKGFTVRLLTNGTLADEGLIEQLVTAGLRDVSISLDSLNPATQDYIYNCDGIFDRVIKNIDLFSCHMPKKNRTLLINTVVSSFNITELPELASFARKKGYYISFIPIENNNVSEFHFAEKDNKRIDEVYASLIKMRRKSGTPILNSSLFLSNSRDYLMRRPRKWRCDAGKLYFSVNPKGELSICHHFKPEGTLLDENLPDFMMSRSFENRRKTLIKECTGCMRPCWAEVSFLMKDPRSLYETLKARTLSWRQLDIKNI